MVIQQKLKIAIVLSSSAMGGMEMRSSRVARLLAKRGHTMYYGCPMGSKLEKSLDNSEVNVFQNHVHGALDIPSAFKLANYLKRKKIHVFMALAGNDYWPSVMAAKMSRVPLVISRSTATPVNKLTARFIRNADRILAVSQGIKTLLVGQGLPEPMIDIIYNGIDTDMFSSNNLPDRQILRKRFDMPPDKFVVGCLGRAEKGQTILLSLDSALDKGPVHYFFAGQNIPSRLGPFVGNRPDLEQRVTLRDMIVYDDMPAVLHALDMVVMLPETEPFSNAVIEAMAMEKPTVLSKTVGNIESVEDGVTGYLVDIHDDRTIIQRLTALRDDPSLVARMGKAARTRAVECFSQLTMLDNYETLYRELAHQNKY